MRKILGYSCRHSMKGEYGIHLVKEDCVYERGKNGHRILETCAFCGEERPIVQDLKLTGQLKRLRII